MSPARFDITDDELAWRKKTGIDRRDEVWDGVWYMTPAPTFEHQRIVDGMIRFLGSLIESKQRGILVSGINVLQHAQGWKNYRIPDLTFVSRREKIPFYAAIGTREVVIVDRDTKATEISRLVARALVSVEPDAEGGLLAETMGVRFRKIEAQPPRLRIEDATDPGVSVEI